MKKSLKAALIAYAVFSTVAMCFGVLLMLYVSFVPGLMLVLLPLAGWGILILMLYLNKKHLQQTADETTGPVRSHMTASVRIDGTATPKTDILIGKKGITFEKDGNIRAVEYSEIEKLSQKKESFRFTTKDNHQIRIFCSKKINARMLEDQFRKQGLISEA